MPFNYITVKSDILNYHDFGTINYLITAINFTVLILWCIINLVKTSLLPTVPRVLGKIKPLTNKQKLTFR